LNYIYSSYMLITLFCCHNVVILLLLYCLQNSDWITVELLRSQLNTRIYWGSELRVNRSLSVCVQIN